MSKRHPNSYTFLTPVITANDETFQTYSNFVSTHLPSDQYESTLVHASKIRQPALAAWRNREKYQLSLVSSFSTNIKDLRPPTNNPLRFKNSPQTYYGHIMAEQRKRAKSNDTRLRDPSAIINLYERAIAQAAAIKTNALLSTISANEQADIQTAEAWLSSFWGSYISFLVRLERYTVFTHNRSYLPSVRTTCDQRNSSCPPLLARFAASRVAVICGSHTSGHL